jgi:hypothetical protein
MARSRDQYTLVACCLERQKGVAPALIIAAFRCSRRHACDGIRTDIAREFVQQRGEQQVIALALDIPRIGRSDQRVEQQAG